MITYLIKFILCSSALLLFYRLFLEKEKMHGFNRFYLLGGLVFALVVPLITIEIPSNPVQSFTPNYESVNLFPDQPVSEVIPDANGVQPAIGYDLDKLLTGIYVAVSLILMIRFLKNILLVIRQKAEKKIIDYQNARLVLLPENVVTYTFLNYIFVSENAFLKNEIEAEILSHELAHVKQKHSLDVLFVELLNVLFWINPVLHFYRKAIRLNHEFLADGAVLNQFQNVGGYQLLLLDKILYTRQINLSSSFNYSITKQRLTMMTRSTSTIVANTKKATVLILITCLTYLISVKEIVAQKAIDQPAKSNPTTRIEGVTGQQFDRYEDIIKKMVETRVGRDGKKRTYYSMKDNNQVKIADVIFRSMSKEQQFKATKVPFIPMLSVPQITRPTQNQLDEWQNGKKFGV